MSTILAPTRGGQQSYPNQDGAIAIAKERGAGLLFLNVTNVEFLNQTASAVVVDVAQELEGMGEFVLTMAKDRALEAGVTAKTLVRQGVFRQVLLEVINEFDVDTVILGSSADDAGHTNREFLEDLGREVVGRSGVEFIILSAGEIVKTIQV